MVETSRRARGHRWARRLTPAFAERIGQVVIARINGTISVFDAGDLTLLEQFTVARPGQVALDQAGNIWVVEGSVDGSTPSVIASYTGCGLGQGAGACAIAALLPGRITDVPNPQGIGIDPSTGHLLVADFGQEVPVPGLLQTANGGGYKIVTPAQPPLSSAQQVVVYDITTNPSAPVEIGTLGQSIVSSDGVRGPQTLINPSSVTADPSGNIYVASSNPSDIKAFDPTGNLLWDLSSTTFATSAAFDPTTDGMDVYSMFEHHHLDYTQTNGQEASWVGHSIGAPGSSDPRVTTAVPLQPIGVRQIGGQKFLFEATALYSSDVAIFLLDGEEVVPVGYVGAGEQWNPIEVPLIVPGDDKTPAGWIWSDPTGDGVLALDEVSFATTTYFYTNRWDVDSEGNLWVAYNQTVQEFGQQRLRLHVRRRR
jgi:hypothetical protein